ncbi:MAG TPA: peptidylprolyl isomerase [Xanthobacteraceae bacterium]|nr:peptidylprolyl isomerase [Xanthobacteraceae bacterium]
MTSRSSAFLPKTPVARRSNRLALLAAVAITVAPLLVGCGKGSDTSKSSGTQPTSTTSTASTPDPNDQVVARVAGVDIRESDLKIASEDLGQQAAALSPAARRDYLIDYVADVIRLAKAAEAKKIGEGPDFQRRLAFFRNKVLAESLLHNEMETAVTEEAMHKVYDDATKAMGNEEEVRARHILIRVVDPNDEKASKEAENKIKALIERINKGEDFATLANEYTEDPSGKQNGGDLDYFTKDQMVPEFSNVAFALDKGQISAPIKTQFGWHVLKVEDKRTRQPPAYDKVKDQLSAIVKRKAQDELINKMRQEAKVERLDKPAETKPAQAKPDDKATDKPVDKPTDKPTDAPPADKPVDKN